MSLRIGVDAWNLPHDRRGLGRYVREVLRVWAAQPEATLRVVLLIPEWPWPWVRRTYREACGYDFPVATRGSAERSCSVVWYPWNGMSWVTRAPAVATLHDASVFALAQPGPSAGRQQRPLVTATRCARRIITDSIFSKSELVRHLSLDPSVVDVVGLGVADVFHKATAPAPADRPYVLFVGEPEERKGLDVLLQAAALAHGDVDVDVIIAGATGAYPLPPAPPAVRLRNLGWVSDEELARLYAGCAALIYPSRYEGFGLPVLEAMAAGAPVIAADIPSLRETAGPAALFVPPGDPAALRAALVRVLTQPALAAQLRARGRRRAASYTWQRTAQGILGVLHTASAAHPRRCDP